MERHKHEPVSHGLPPVPPEELDSFTKLPKLPKGYFFRFWVTDEHTLVCELRQNRWWRGSRKVHMKSSPYVARHKYTSIKHRMQHLALNTRDTCYDRDYLQKVNPIDPALLAIEGDYPPKKLD